MPVDSDMKTMFSLWFHICYDPKKHGDTLHIFSHHSTVVAKIVNFLLSNDSYCKFVFTCTRLTQF